MSASAPAKADSPSRLYHYTNAAALTGILREKHLRATDVRYSADRKELEYGRELIESEIGARLASALNSQASDASLVAETLRRIDPWNIKNSETAYAASFSSEPDDLSQWRGYGHFCLALDTARFLVAGWELLKCSYGAECNRLVQSELESLTQWSTEQLTKFTPESNPEHVGQKEDHLRQVERHSTTRLLRVAAKAKRKPYAIENEWRAVSFGAPSVDLAMRTNGSLTHYLKLSIADALLAADLWLGPEVASVEVHSAAKRLMEHYIGESWTGEIKPSEI